MNARSPTSRCVLYLRHSIPFSSSAHPTLSQATIAFFQQESLDLMYASYEEVLQHLTEAGFEVQVGEDPKVVYRNIRIDERRAAILVRRARSRRRILGLFRTTVGLLVAQRRAAERTYAPGGKGFHDCWASFEISSAA